MVELLEKSISSIIEKHPYAVDFFDGYGISNIDTNKTFNELTKLLNDTFCEDKGIDKSELSLQFVSFLEKMVELSSANKEQIKSITIIGGQNKSGELENKELVLLPGEIYCIVGPTGSGKSRLLADIECLAQEDTPSKRKILLNGKFPDFEERFSMSNKLIAQLSQNMNFVMDLSVKEFITLHAESRMIAGKDEIVENIIVCANDLAGEKFSPETPLTQLSGGQSRSLMIADTALLSCSPIVLIDEIENAGVDRRKALDLLVKKEKIVLMSTHDPILALLGNKRIVIKNGGIYKIIETSDEEKNNLERLQRFDTHISNIRNALRRGEIINESLVNFF